MITKGKKIKISYDLAVNGKLVKSTSLRYVHGHKEILPGLEKALRGMRVGDRKRICLAPEQAYGQENPSSIREFPKSRFPKRDHFVGREMKSSKDGKYFASVREVRKDTLVLNFNHPFAGKTLEYIVQVLSIEGDNGR
jgi:FKBP-type peptidyl-prolyl cis-trans isomerase SlyD